MRRALAWAVLWWACRSACGFHLSNGWLAHERTGSARQTSGWEAGRPRTAQWVTRETARPALKGSGGDGEEDEEINERLRETLESVSSALVPIEDRTEESSPSEEKFTLVYTCNRCETRNMITVNKQSWEEGIVISTCQGCNVKHLLADSQGLMDLGRFTNFSNILDAKREAGEEVSVLDSSNQDLLSRFDLRTSEDGSVEFVPRQGEEVMVKKDKVSAAGPKVDESLKVSDVSNSLHWSKSDDKNGEATDGQEEAAGQGGVDKADEHGDGPVPPIGATPPEPGTARVSSIVPIRVEAPEDAEEGDLVQLDVGMGSVLLLPLPSGTYGGCQLEITGQIEFLLPKGKLPGDVLTLEVPSGERVLVSVPENADESSSLKIAYPVKVIPFEDTSTSHEGADGGSGEGGPVQWE